MPRGVVGQNGPKKHYFAISSPWGSGREKVLNVQQLQHFQETFCERPDIPPKTAPSTGQLRFPVFRPEFLQVSKAVLGQKNSISHFPARGGPVVRIVKCKKVAEFLGETVLGGRIPPQKCPWHREIAFSCSWARNFSECPGPRMGQNR